jgi:hypothetical protein
MSKLTARLVGLAALGTLAACLDPQVSDDISVPSLILPAGAAVPSIYETDDGAEIRENEGVSGTVPLLTGFVDGALVHFWDFGPAVVHASPVFRLIRTTSGATELLDHPPIFTSIPGEGGYSPYATVFTVEVTALYAGELITSQAALSAAQDRGLLGPGKPAPTNLDWPVVDPDILVDVGGGQTTAATHVFYYEGFQGVYFDLGESSLGPDNVSVPENALYELRREGGDPLSEAVRHVDLDGDGDTNDTNDIFASGLGDLTWSPRCHVISVTVGRDVDSIDTTHSEANVEIGAESDLFTSAGAPIAGTVLGLTDTRRIFNCPQLGTGGI